MSTPAASGPQRPTSLSAFVYERLLEQIAAGRSRAGDRIVIDQVAKALGVSLIPVREALARLNAEGLVEHQLHRGYRVTSSPDTKDYRDLFLARLVVESGAIRQSAGKVSAQAIRRLRAINDQIGALRPGKTFRGYRQFVELNDEFHSELVGLAGSTELTGLFGKLAYGSRVARDLQGRGVPDLAENVREHGAIIAALAAGDTEAAAKAAADHILAGQDRFLCDLKRLRAGAAVAPAEPAAARLRAGYARPGT